MTQKVLIVEDQFIEANNLQLMLEKAGYQVCAIARSVDEAVLVIEKERPGLALVDIQLRDAPSGIELAPLLKQRNIAFIYISANSNHDILMQAKATQPYGFIVKPFRERDLIVTLEIAQYRHENSLETAVRKEEQLRMRLVRVGTPELDWHDRMLHIVKALQTFLAFDYLEVSAGISPFAGKLTSFLRIGYDEYQAIGLEELHTVSCWKTSGDTRPLQPTDLYVAHDFFVGQQFEDLIARHGLRTMMAQAFDLKSALVLPIRLSNESFLNLMFYSRRPNTYHPGQITLLDRLRNPLLSAIQDMLEATASDQGPRAKPMTEIRKTPPQDTIGDFDGIIGKSHSLLNVFDEIAHVAPVDTSVLILGESGTGKEQIAQSIHNLSKRKARPYVKINCAALPFHLIESELFGHERGAFTGAMDRRIGKFEQADTGTIFLDEIGDMPYELQAKLLRVLQEKEIERIGGKSPIRVDVRIIAATNRNLEKEVANGRFRLDLYYRLNTFPITLPPLRDRKPDIPILIDHFIQVFNAKSAKNIFGISRNGLDRAMAYHWPGNIRELENLVERAVLIEPGREIQALAIASFGGIAEPASVEANGFKTISEMEREHILEALRKCNGKIWGSGGAAQLLNLPASTLNSKIKKLDIKRGYN